MLESQEVYNKVLFALRKQGRPSINTEDSHEFGDAGTVCMYRNEDDEKCAAGHLIEDQFYDSKTEGYSLRNAPIDDAIKLEEWLAECPWRAALFNALTSSGIRTSDIALVNRLQRAHDIALQQGVEQWEAAMKVVAVDYVLNYTEPA